MPNLPYPSARMHSPTSPSKSFLQIGSHCTLFRLSTFLCPVCHLASWVSGDCFTTRLYRDFSGQRATMEWEFETGKQRGTHLGSTSITVNSPRLLQQAWDSLARDESQINYQWPTENKRFGQQLQGDGCSPRSSGSLANACLTKDGGAWSAFLVLMNSRK